jgi:hypothetical protein
MTTLTSDSDRPTPSKRRKVTGSRNRAQDSKRAKVGGRATVGGAKPQPKSKKVTMGSGAKKRLRNLVKIGSLLKKANVAGYIISDVMKSHGLSEKEWKEGPGTLAYAKKQEGK